MLIPYPEGNEIKTIELEKGQKVMCDGREATILGFEETNAYCWVVRLDFGDEVGNSFPNYVRPMG